MITFDNKFRAIFKFRNNGNFEIEKIDEKSKLFRRNKYDFDWFRICLLNIEKFVIFFLSFFFCNKFLLVENFLVLIMYYTRHSTRQVVWPRRWFKVCNKTWLKDTIFGLSLVKISNGLNLLLLIAKKIVFFISIIMWCIF